MSRLKDFFPDIPECAFFKEAFQYQDKAYVCFDFDDTPTLDDLYLVDILEVLPTNNLFNDGLSVLCRIKTYTNEKIVETEDVEGVLIYPCKDNKVVTSEGLKSFATVIEDGVSKKVLLSEKEAHESFYLKMILEVPGTILNLHIDISGDLVFSTKKQISEYIKAARFNSPLFYNQIISINVGKNTLVFDDYKIYENDKLSKRLDGKSLFEYMCYNCKTTPETKNKMDFLKIFPLKIKQIIPVIMA